MSSTIHNCQSYGVGCQWGIMSLSLHNVRGTEGWNLNLPVSFILQVKPITYTGLSGSNWRLYGLCQHPPCAMDANSNKNCSALVTYQTKGMALQCIASDCNQPANRGDRGLVVITLQIKQWLDHIVFSLYLNLSNRRMFGRHLMALISRTTLNEAEERLLSSVSLLSQRGRGSQMASCTSLGLRSLDC